MYLLRQISIEKDNESVENKEKWLHFKGLSVLHVTRGNPNKGEVCYRHDDGGERGLHPHPVFDTRVWEWGNGEWGNGSINTNS